MAQKEMYIFLYYNYVIVLYNLLMIFFNLDGLIIWLEIHLCFANIPSFYFDTKKKHQVEEKSVEIWIAYINTLYKHHWIELFRPWCNSRVSYMGILGYM